MRVRDIMTSNPVCCAPDADLQQIAQWMDEYDCGEIPVVDQGMNFRVIGVITDRDIACRVVAKGKDAHKLKARDVMSSPVVTTQPDVDIEECCALMEEARVRRVPVVNEAGGCCGIISQADLVRRAPNQIAAQVVRDISRPSSGASRAAGFAS